MVLTPEVNFDHLIIDPFAEILGTAWLDTFHYSPRDIAIKIKRNINDHVILFKYWITPASFVYFDKDTIISKKGDIRQIAISDNSDEKISFDIFCLFPYDNYLLETYLDKFFYFNKGLFQDIIRYQYKDFYLSIPKLYDEMLTHMYGKNYIIPPQTWSNNDYKNLATREELEKLVNEK